MSRTLVPIAGLLATAMFASVASADEETARVPWTVAEMNEVIDQTNFILNGCSGTLIAPRLLLTNHHCVTRNIVRVKRKVVEDGVVVEKEFEEFRDVTVSQRHVVGFREVGVSTYQTVIVAYKQESDLALLEMRATSTPHTTFSQVYPDDNDLMRGAPVFVVGNPAGLDATLTRGVVSSTSRMFRVPWANNQEVPFIQVDAGIFGGNSGGALYNEFGELIGVPAANIPGSAVGLAIPYTLIRDFLDEHCYGAVWNPDAPSFEECTNPPEEDDD